jgi:hypothetical protein
MITPKGGEKSRREQMMAITISAIAVYGVSALSGNRVNLAIRKDSNVLAKSTKLADLRVHAAPRHGEMGCIVVFRVDRFTGFGCRRRGPKVERCVHATMVD